MNLNTKLLLAVFVGFLVPVTGYMVWSQGQHETQVSPADVSGATVQETSSANAEVVAKPKEASELTPFSEVLNRLPGKWRSAESQNLIYTLKPDFAFQESRLYKDSEFMVPQGTWRLEQVPGTSQNFTASYPNGSLMFIRTSEKGVARSYLVSEITETNLALYDIEDNVTRRFTRIAQ